MERDVCCCYRKTGLVSKGFLESGENTIPAIRGPASDLYLRQFCTLECLPLHFLWFPLGARPNRIQECHPGHAAEFRPQCFFLGVTWDWASRRRLMCRFEVNLTYFEQGRSLGPQVSWATGTVLSSLSPGHVASLTCSIDGGRASCRHPFLCGRPHACAASVGT